jgi:cysteine synthase A
MSHIAESVLRAIGRTPVVHLTSVVPRGAADVIVKLEFYNPTGSYKDRMALGDDRRRRARGACGRHARRRVHRRQHRLVARDGVRGKAIRVRAPLVGRVRGREAATMRALGAELRIVPSDGGKVTPALFERFRRRSPAGGRAGHLLDRSVHNTDALDGYAGIGRELRRADRRIDRRVLRRRRHRRHAERRRARAAEAGSSTPHRRARARRRRRAMTKGRSGAHPSRASAPADSAAHDSKPYDEARAIAEEDARAMARRLARERGLLVGTSSALNIARRDRAGAELGPGKTVATVAVDTGLKYLAGDLFEV